MKRIRPFSIGEATRPDFEEKGKRIVTRSGKQAEILTWGANCNGRDIVGLVDNGEGGNSLVAWWDNGRISMSKELPNDLFIEEETEERLPDTFEPVLVRNKDDEMWSANLFGHYLPDNRYPYYCVFGSFRQCVPYKGNEWMTGTKCAPRSKEGGI